MAAFDRNKPYQVRCGTIKAEIVRVLNEGKPYETLLVILTSGSEYFLEYDMNGRPKKRTVSDYDLVNIPEKPFGLATYVEIESGEHEYDIVTKLSNNPYNTSIVTVPILYEREMESKELAEFICDAINKKRFGSDEH